MTTYGWKRRALAPLLLSFILHPSSFILSSAAADATIAKIEVFPPDVSLNTSRDRQKFVVVATRADGVTLDVTGQAQMTLANSALAKLDSATLFPVADGETTLNVAFAGFTVQAPLVVKDAAADRPISFKLDVMPVFMRAGCNTGSCHGAARGKDGFRLSLFGF
ncbi:MAG TPA: cell surface protein, partial [Pirellulales bacterium]|nr:cell surface protein [Pirellulales bacterium]